MVQKWHLLFFVLPMIVVSACGKVTDTPVVVLTQASNPATSTVLPLTYSPPSSTRTLTVAPTVTSTPTEIPPTSTPEPFLPKGLAQLGADNIAQLELITSLPVKEIYSLAFSPSGNMLATLSEPWDDRFNDYLEVWGLNNGEQILLVDKWDSPWGLFFPPDETTLYADKRLYDLASGEVIGTLDVLPLAFSPDGKIYATGDYLGYPEESSIIHLIDTVTQNEIFSLTNPGMVQSLEFSPDGHLLSGGFQGFTYHVKVWDISTKEILIDLVDHFTGLTFSPDGNMAASVKNGQVYIYSTDEMTYRASYAFSDPQASSPDSMDFSQNGEILAIEDLSTIRFLVPNTGKELLNLPDECYEKFSPDGKILVTWCYQGDLKFWGVKP